MRGDGSGGKRADDLVDQLLVGGGDGGDAGMRDRLGAGSRERERRDRRRAAPKTRGGGRIGEPPYVELERIFMAEPADIRRFAFRRDRPVDPKIGSARPAAEIF